MKVMPQIDKRNVHGLRKFLFRETLDDCVRKINEGSQGADGVQTLQIVSGSQSLERSG